MNILEFVSWCQIKNIVTNFEEIEANWDPDAKHYKFTADNGDTKVSMVFAVMHEQAVLVSANLYARTSLGLEVSRPDVFSKIIEKFFPDESA